MKLDANFLTRLKSDSRVPQVMGELLPDLKRNGQAYVAKVPWRQDDSPSLQIYQATDNVWRFKDFPADEGGDCRFVLLDSRGRIPRDYQRRRNPSPLNIATVGTDLYTLAAQWTRRGRDDEYLITWGHPIAVTKVPALSQPD